MNAFAWSGLLTGVSCTMMAGLVYLTNRAGRANQLWALFCLAVSVWGFGALLVGLAPSPDVAIMGWRIAHIGVVFIPTLFYHFVLAFIDVPRPRYLWVGYLISGVWLALDATPWFITRVRLVFGEFYFNASADPLYSVFTVSFLIPIFVGLWQLWAHARRTQSKRQRLQTRWLFFGTAVGFIGGGTCFLPVFGIDVYPWGNFAVPLFPLMMTYAILRYRLMALDLALVKGGSFLVVYSLVVGIPLAAGYFGRTVWQAAFGELWWAAPVVLMGLLASVGPWVFIAIQKQAEARLAGDQRGYQKILWQASQGMTNIRNLEHLLRLVVHVITRTVGLRNAAIFLEDPKAEGYVLRACRYRDAAGAAPHLKPEDPLVRVLRDTHEPLVLERLGASMALKNGHAVLKGIDLSLMKALRAAVLVPIFAQDKLVGAVVLGEKCNGQLFSNEDVVVFSTLANQAALAIENARFYEEERQRQAALFHAATLASLGTMASSMGHQVNNRFNVVSVIASTQKLKLKSLLAKEPTLESYRKALDDCLAQFDSLQEEAVRGGQIFTAIRKIARPSSEGHKPMTLKSAVQAGIDIVQYKVRLDQLDFRKDVPDDLPLIVGDLAQLGECFLNLIDNGYDAIRMKEQRLKPEGFKGMIRITAWAVTECGTPWVVVEVEDNGIGMNDKEREHLFIPFFTTKATAEKGTGLGLYVIKKIIEAHKGKIEVNSAHQVGSTFTIRLPTAPAVPAAPEAPR
jgi:signal transduction histidine kinase